MTDMIDKRANANDEQLGEEGMNRCRSQLSRLLDDLVAEDVRCQAAGPRDDGLPDDGDAP